MHHRVKVEIAWLQALSQAGFAEIKPSAAANDLLNAIANNFPKKMRLESRPLKPSPIMT